MKIPVRCYQCDSDKEAALLEIGNDHVHRVICDDGHESSLVISQQKHEILFEVAAQAIVDGYYREAISSFSASLERYYEFFMKVVSIGNNFDEFEKSWKQVASQSERQLGGYIFLYFNVYGCTPNILPLTFVTQRNNVIHKGNIPSRADAVKFGVEVAKIINDGCNLLHRTKEANMMEIVRQAICPNNSADFPVTVLSTYLNILSEHDLLPFEDYLNTVQTHNKPRF